jgi:hypothetical protein
MVGVLLNGALHAATGARGLRGSSFERLLPADLSGQPLLMREPG